MRSLVKKSYILFFCLLFSQIWLYGQKLKPYFGDGRELKVKIVYDTINSFKVSTTDFENLDILGFTDGIESSTNYSDLATVVSDLVSQGWHVKVTGNYYLKKFTDDNLIVDSIQNSKNIFINVYLNNNENTFDYRVAIYNTEYSTGLKTLRQTAMLSKLEQDIESFDKDQFVLNLKNALKILTYSTEGLIVEKDLEGYEYINRIKVTAIEQSFVTLSGVVITVPKNSIVAFSRGITMEEGNPTSERDNNGLLIFLEVSGVQYLAYGTDELKYKSSEGTPFKILEGKYKKKGSFSIVTLVEANDLENSYCETKELMHVDRVIEVTHDELSVSPIQNNNIKFYDRFGPTINLSDITFISKKELSISNLFTSTQLQTIDNPLYIMEFDCPKTYTEEQLLKTIKNYDKILAVVPDYDDETGSIAIQGYLYQFKINQDTTITYSTKENRWFCTGKSTKSLIPIKIIAEETSYSQLIKNTINDKISAAQTYHTLKEPTIVFANLFAATYTGGLPLWQQIAADAGLVAAEGFVVYYWENDVDAAKSTMIWGAGGAAFGHILGNFHKAIPLLKNTPTALKNDEGYGEVSELFDEMRGINEQDKSKTSKQILIKSSLNNNDNVDLIALLEKVEKDKILTDAQFELFKEFLLDGINKGEGSVISLLFKFATEDGYKLIKAWEGLITSPDFIRRNVSILVKADELLAAGFTRLDLEKLSLTLNKLKNRSISNTDLEKITEYALQARKQTNQYSSLGIETDLFKQIDELASSAKFKNPEDLKSFLSEQQLLQNIADNPGNLEALNEAVRVMKNGDEVLLEGKGAIKGDIVNVTKTESIQYKAFTGTSSSTTTTNLKKAAEQFISEPPAAGYKKIAKLKILDSGNPEFNSTALDLKNRFQQYLNQNISNATGDNLRALTQIRVENASGLSKFEIIDNVVTIIP